MASLLRRRLLLWDQQKGLKNTHRHSDDKCSDVDVSRSRQAYRTTEVNKLIEESLGPKLEALKCVCGCSCNEGVHFKSLIYRCVEYISEEPRNEEIIHESLRMIHQRSMCPFCYHQHRWGKPLTGKFVQHMKETFRSLDGWDSLPPVLRSQPKQAFGVVLDGEPPRFQSLTYEGYRKLLGIPETDQMYRTCIGRRRDGSGCDARFEESSVILNVYDLHMTVLTGATVIDENLHDIKRSFFCSRCSSDAKTRSLITEFVRQSTDLLTNPAWLQFHTQDQQSHQADGEQQIGSDSLTTKIEPRTESYQILAELRQQLLQSKDPEFIKGFLKLAEEIKLSLRSAGGGPGASIGNSYGGGTGAS